MRSASSVSASIGASRYASLIRIALAEKPSTPATAMSGPDHAADVGARVGGALIAKARSGWVTAARAAGQSQRTSPAHEVASITAPKAMRYHAKGVKSWRDT